MKNKKLLHKSSLHSPEVIILLEKKQCFFQDLIQKTILNIQKNKILDILGISDVNKCIHILYDLCKKVKEMYDNRDNVTTEVLINQLQEINNELSSILKIYGTESLDDLLTICFGYNNEISHNDSIQFELLKKYFHPTNYNVVPNTKNIVKTINCYDISQGQKRFHLKVYGMKIIIYDIVSKKTLSIIGIVDDIMIEYLNNKYIDDIKKNIKTHIPAGDEFRSIIFTRFQESLTLKDFFIYDYGDIYRKFVGYMSQLNMYKQKSILQMVKEFIDSDLFTKRLTLIQLLIKLDNYDNQYLAYLLYDILSNDSNGSIDTHEQSILFDSFPWSIKQYFRDAMRKTVQYTNELSNFDSTKIPLEQQICLLNADDIVKEKAMVRLKEVKAKSEDSGIKARQYLEGLLKIPFRIYKREPILYLMNEIKENFKEIVNKEGEKDKVYTSMEIIKYINQNQFELTNVNDTKPALIEKVKKINEHITTLQNVPKINYSNKSKTQLNSAIQQFISTHGDITTFGSIQKKLDVIKKYMVTVKETMDKAVYGHNKAKKQIERIIGQWINGEQDGHCFGFEGPPGVGKTSLAKFGLANCLKDETGVSRPFAMIQMGGDSNGSTLHGHNYTYVGSTWGSIVQILIDKKCLNPIIFIDELDKISKTENGREIIGILTHLLDPTQNDSFQDKYFSGIDLDLSKALFVLSYNDVDAVDRILLDRIHRIKFSNLSLEEKRIITRRHILPEVFKKMGLENMIHFSDEVILFIIDEYTSESGVRKLKEIFFEIVGEINLDVLTNDNAYLEFPINITISDISEKYFHDKHKIKHKKIHDSSMVGLINGLWANSLGMGGIIPIQVKPFPSEKYMDLKLTGMQGDVMKESMNVAQTLAWSLSPKEVQEGWKQAIHVHCPEGAVPKDGPSAGGAITTSIYSLLNNKKIKNTFAMTGEISLDGSITEIGGLDVKILGGIKAGITNFIYPSENDKEYQLFITKHKNDSLITSINFHPVSHISEVFLLIFECDDN